MKRIFALLSTVCLAACATSSPNSSVYEAQAQGDSSASQAAPRLSPRKLERGECGLFIWSAEESRRFLLFSQAQEDKAIWASPQGEQELVITGKSGQIFQQQYTMQAFAQSGAVNAADSLSNLELSLRNIEEILSGTRFKAGTLSQTTEDGLKRVVPVVGIAACR